MFSRARCLVPCREVMGGARIDSGPLQVEPLRDVLLVPLGAGQPPGVFDAEGRLVRAAAYFRGLPEPHFPIEGAGRLQQAVEDAPYAPEDVRYLFAGHYTAHYGHFFFALLSRLWALPQPVPQDLRIVLLANGDPAAPFRVEFSRAILQALGLTPGHFASFPGPVRFRRLEAPWPAAEENGSAHPAFAELCHRIGRTLLQNVRTAGPGGPVYLTKQRVHAGVHSIVNEDAFCAALQRRGFAVVSPEALALERQVALWADHPVVAATFGSMLHTSIFTPARRYVALNPESWINSNQVLLDAVNGNHACILYPRDHYLREPATAEYGLRLRLRDPDAAARDLSREVARQMDLAEPGRRLRRPLRRRLAQPG